jgi:histidyl-tRNA synthetase
MNVAAAELARELRTRGLRLELGDESFRLKKAFETAEKLGILRVIIVGENEAASNQFSVKNLKTGAQTQVARGALAAALAEPSKD